MRNTITYITSALLMFALPLGASAASSRPTCSLTISTEQGRHTVTKSEDISVVAGEAVTLSWKSKNAKDAEDSNGKTISTSGTLSTTVSQETTYEYTFSNGNRKTTCEVTLTPVEISIDPVSGNSSRPTFSGTAEGMKSIVLTVRKEGTSRKLFEKSVRVRDGEWSIRSTKSLSSGAYEVSLRESKRSKSTLLAETVAVGEASVGTAQVSIATIPLLTGGSTRDGATVPVSYLQVRNTGRSHATLSSFTVQQRGSASTNAIASLTVVDSLGTTVGTSSAYPFKNGAASIPIASTLQPGEMRLYTIKATVGNTRTELYKNLMLDVSGATLNGTPSAQFPLRGTTWTLIP